MSLFAQGDPVKLNPSVLEDQALKSNHHLLERILKEDRHGEVREQDLAKSTPKAFYYWVKFHYAAFLLSEFHIMKSTA
jgi:hypothetical protein